MLNNKVYNFLKWFATIFLPAVGVLYYALAEAWDIQRTFPVNATINSIVVFIGVIIGISTRKYNKQNGPETVDGDLVVTQVDGEKYLALGVNESIESMQSKQTVRLNVVDKSSEA